VELRVPLLDQQLVTYVNSLSEKYKIRGHTTKWLLKKTLERYLPNEIVYRRKVGFGAPIRIWIKHDLKELMNKYLSQKALKKFGVFDSNRVQWLIDENEKGRLDAAYTIFSVLCVQIWISKFVG
jgi:asparagine synthase (glutamine-hydrolysing)